jgi:hypothetical protein
MPTTPTEIAKNALQFVVAAKVANITKDQLEEHTEMDPDGLPVKAISASTGYLVAGLVRPYTDRAVDATASRIKRWRAERKERKQKKSE